ncbi:MAG: CxxC-x17-CxxC domain-containing protein [Candidatus Limnocylindrales bacterium]
MFSLYQDKVLTCADCGQQFVFSASEQQFYADRQFSEPRRCPSCRASRKASRGSGSYSGGGGSYSGGSSYSSGYTSGSIGSHNGGSGYSGGGSRAPREMFPAVCSDCGRETMVPFRPTSGKPVYCNDCFAKHRG